MKLNISPTNHEKKLGADDFIVSKTDTSGRITYVNRIFMDICGLPESKLLTVQHNIIRHPDMPRGVFRFMWETLKAEHEFFGFVKNLCADGSFYWVFANITPDYDKDHKFTGYYSVRRQPPESALKILVPVYKEMLAIEKRSSTRDAPTNAINYLIDVVKSTGAKDYNSLVLSLYKPKGL